PTAQHRDPAHAPSLVFESRPPATCDGTIHHRSADRCMRGSPSSRAACAFARCYDQAPMMNRRRFLRTVSVSLLAAPLAAQAQQAGKVYNIGYLGLDSSFAGSNRTAFYRGLQEHGWIEGQNFVLTTRFAQFKSERLRELVSELVQRKVDVIVVSTAEGALAAKHGTSAIHIVTVDPAAAG